MPDQSTWPAHLRDDAPYKTCDTCGRKSWSPETRVGTSCGMPQPSGPSCEGHFAETERNMPADRDSLSRAAEQHTIPKDTPPITEMMTQYGIGTSSFDFVGETIVTAYDIPDSDRQETLLLCESGRVLCISTDPGYNDDEAMTRNDTRWEVVLYDATDTEAGRAIKKLAPGQWL